MTPTIKAIMTRILNQEIEQQRKWQQSEAKAGFGGMTDREAIITEIKQFMEENGIKIEAQ